MVKVLLLLYLMFFINIDWYIQEYFDALAGVLQWT